MSAWESPFGGRHLLFDRNARPVSNVWFALSRFAALLQQFCRQAGPPGLMTGSDAGTTIAVEIFVEKNQVAEVGVGLKLLHASINRTPPPLIFQEDLGQAARQLSRNLPQRQLVS